ncbi:hypothetical protein [Haloplanus pelagicus]|jgi:NhaP-type Na+/H+ or K+/H+ antiporter|uniref:hypothetical protein n=1 Tax=Haloplanus pelagicus TaxID=2949995 RepID=UPI00203C8A6D|nr:hypothetical protein [Haloplanus sp. HW8-1]
MTRATETRTFEGAFHLRVERIRTAHRETLRLVTVGVTLSFLATAVIVLVVVVRPAVVLYCTRGDRPTLIGRREVVRDAIEYCTS